MKGNEFEYFIDNLSLPTLLAKLSFALLLLSMLFYWFQASFKSNRGKETLLAKAPSITMGLANIALALMLSIRWFESGHFPLSNLYESLLFLSWSLTSIHFVLERTVLPKVNFNGESISPTLGAITAPLSLFTNAFATFSLPQEMQKVTVLVPALQSNWLIMHVSVMMVSYAALLSGSLLAMAFLVINFAECASPRQAHYSPKNSSKIGKLFESNKLKQSLTLRSTISSIASSFTNLFDVHSSSYNSFKKQSFHLPGKGTKNVQPGPTASFQSTIGLREICAYEIEDFKEDCNDFKEVHKPMIVAQTKNRVTNGARYSSQDVAYLAPNALIKGLACPEGAQHKQEGTQEVLASHKEEVQKQNTEAVYNNLKNTLDNLSYRAIGLGFALLTIGIFSGAVWANEAWGSYWSWDPKETWAFVTWLVFAMYLHTRLSRGWVGKESAFVAAFGFLVIWFCYLGVNLFGRGLHSYGWFPVK